MATRSERDPLIVGRVIGDVLDNFTKTIPLTVTYPYKEISYGCKLKPSQVVNQARIDIGGDDLRTFYTLVMVDPDAPSPSEPTLREYLHCSLKHPVLTTLRDTKAQVTLVGELALSIPSGTKREGRDDIIYVRTAPRGVDPASNKSLIREQENSHYRWQASRASMLGKEIVNYESPRPTMGIHRFLFVLYQQLGRQTVDAPGWCQNFNTKEFVELYNLGSPVAAVFLNCQWESGSGGRISGR